MSDVKNDDEQLLLERKIHNSRMIMISSFILSIVSLILGIILLNINLQYNVVTSTIAFSITGVLVVVAIFFEYRHRTILKYYYIVYATYHKEEERVDKTKEPRDESKVLEENQPGSFFKNVRKYLERHRGP